MEKRTFHALLIIGVALFIFAFLPIVTDINMKLYIALAGIFIFFFSIASYLGLNPNDEYTPKLFKVNKQFFTGTLGVIFLVVSVPFLYYAPLLAIPGALIGIGLIVVTFVIARKKKK